MMYLKQPFKGSKGRAITILKMLRMTVNCL